MPKFDPSTPTRSAEYGGVSVLAPEPFTEGHTLTGPEAAFLNRQVASVVGNSFAGMIRRKLASMTAANEALAKNKDKAIAATARVDTDEAGKTTLHVFTVADIAADWQAEYNTAYGDYEPGVSNRSSGGTTHSLVEKFAHSIAAEKVAELIKSKGRKVSEFKAATTNNEAGVSKFNQLVAQFIAVNPWVTALAEQQVAGMSQAASEGDITIE